MLTKQWKKFNIPNIYLSNKYLFIEHQLSSRHIKISKIQNLAKIAQYCEKDGYVNIQISTGKKSYYKQRSMVVL